MVKVLKKKNEYFEGALNLIQFRYVLFEIFELSDEQIDRMINFLTTTRSFNP